MQYPGYRQVQTIRYPPERVFSDRAGIEKGSFEGFLLGARGSSR